MVDRLTGLLIAGTSHTGKSTFASSIGQKLGWRVLSTDTLGRHPGRPWPKVAPHIAEYYARLSKETIDQFLLHHHENMWPGIERFVSDMRRKASPFVFEGSVLRPEYCAKLTSPEIRTVCFHADHDFLRARMLEQSGYRNLPGTHRTLVETFISRSLRENDRHVQAAGEHGLTTIDVSDKAAVERFRLEIIDLACG